uniref:Uncharacterized protein n=1 Tax=Gokushovirinae environmental samples TaxID=1478972 RepID=A0A2R3UA94_9VIRU|nr:hypothetical protein [Gokushovirinae environmental samples]
MTSFEKKAPGAGGKLDKGNKKHHICDMKTTTVRQRNYRLRNELEGWINYFLKEIKKNDPTDLPRLKKNIVELEKTIVEYVQLNKRKNKCD